MRRRTFLVGAAASGAALFLPRIGRAASDDARARIVALERRSGGRLGVYAMHANGAPVLAYRAGERFPMCSTFKFLLVSAVLARVDLGDEHWHRHISYGKSDLLAYAPVTTKNVAAGFMTVGALCQAAVVYSDNTAANLLVAAIGGPRSVTHFARSLGDSFTRLDRMEPAMSNASSGDPRDTTTPASMSRDMRKVLFRTALSKASRDRLRVWMIACQTGIDCIRAGVPQGWIVGDKTGSGGNGTRNDIAFLLPPRDAGPIFVAAYLTGATVGAPARDATLAEVGRIVSAALDDGA